MIILKNEFFLRLIFNSFNVSDIKHLTKTLKSKTMSYIVLRILSYENIFKTIGKTIIFLRDEVESDTNEMAMLPNGNLITLSRSKLNIWDTNTNQCLKTVEDKIFHSLMILLPNNIIVTSTYDGHLKFLDIGNDFNCVKDLRIKGDVYKLFLLSNKNLICFSRYLIADDDFDFPVLNEAYCITIIDYMNNFKITEYDNCKQRISLLVNLINNKLASGYEYHNVIRIWDVCDNNLKFSWSIRGHENSITSLLFIEKDNLLLSGAMDKTIKAWDIGGGFLCIKTINVSSIARCLLLLPGGYLAYAGFEGIISILNIWSYEYVNTIKIDKGEIFDLLLLKDNKIAAILNRNYFNEYGVNNIQMEKMAIFDI
jgi:WD40 repeat protein